MLKVLKQVRPGKNVQAMWCIAAWKDLIKISVMALFIFLSVLMVDDLRAQDRSSRSFPRINFPIWFEYNGVYCGQLGATWVPGTIGRRKRFTPYYLQIRYIDRTIKITTDATRRKSLLARRVRIVELM